MEQLLKRRLNYQRNTVSVPRHFDEKIQKKSFSRLVAVNQQLDLCCPVVNGRVLSDIEAIAKGYVPDTVQQLIINNWRNVPQQVDNSGLSDEEIMAQVKYNRIGVESNERFRMAKEGGLFSPPSPAPAPQKSE